MVGRELFMRRVRRRDDHERMPDAEPEDRRRARSIHWERTRHWADIAIIGLTLYMVGCGVFGLAMWMVG